MSDPGTYRALAERAWAWVLTQVREGEGGLWLPERPDQAEPGEYPYGMHSGIGGLAHAMAEIRMTRPLTPAETALGEGIRDTLVGRIPETTEYDYFDGLVSTIGVLTALGTRDGIEQAVAGLRELATPDGWPVSWLGPPRAVPEGRCTDATLGTASVLLGALWAQRYDVPGAAPLAEHAIEVLLAENEPRDGAAYWPFVPRRFLLGEDVQMPNWSHGTAGVAAALTAAGLQLGRPELTELAASSVGYLLAVGDRSDGGLRLPHRIPGQPDLDTFTYSWCHGPTGTSLLFAALDRAGAALPGDTPEELELACLHSLRVSGIPERRHPGFWDNDGRCCGTAGVGDVVLNAWRRHGREEDLAFAVVLGDALVERAVDDGTHAFWRFVEHRIEEPLLPPGPGWMQGAAGIAAYLFRLARVLDQGRDAEAVARMDTWWAVGG